MTSSPARSRKTKWAVRGALAGLAALIAAYVRCGAGLGVGGGGALGTKPAAPAPKPAALRCQLRLEGPRLWMMAQTGQSPTTIEAAVAACKAAGGADVVVTGDAVLGNWEALRAALDGAGVPTYVRGAAAPPR